MTKDKRGYWRVTIWDKLGCPPVTYWFDYDDKDVAEIVMDEAYKKLDWKKPVMELDKEYTPADPHDEEEDAWDYGWI
jgi:hypothetical protein